MNLTDSSIENTIKPLPVEPAEKDWGVGVNAMEIRIPLFRA